MAQPKYAPTLGSARQDRRQMGEMRRISGVDTQNKQNKALDCGVSSNTVSPRLSPSQNNRCGFIRGAAAAKQRVASWKAKKPIWGM